MFRTFSLSIIRSLALYTQQWYMAYWFADSLRAASCQQTCPDDGQRNCPKYVESFISVFNQLDAQNLFHNEFYFMPLHVFEHMCSKHVKA